MNSAHDESHIRYWTIFFALDGTARRLAYPVVFNLYMLCWTKDISVSIKTTCAVWNKKNIFFLVENLYQIWACMSRVDPTHSSPNFWKIQGESG